MGLIVYSIIISVVAVVLLVLLILNRRAGAADRKKESQPSWQQGNALTAEERENNAKTDFLFNMSHDVRTPMTAILGYTAIARRHVDEPARVTEYLDKIELSGNQLLELVNRVIELSRIEVGKVKMQETVVDLDDMAEDCCAAYSEITAERGIRLTHNTDALMHRVILADSERLKQVLTGVLGNAVKYTMNGGTIDFSVSEEPDKTSDKERFIFTVADTGIGMSKEYIKTIFEPFSKEQSTVVSGVQGTGLDMSIAKKLAELMGGSIEVESEIGKGTTVVVTVPLRLNWEPEEAASKSAASDAPDLSLAGTRILLVEDDEMNREIAAELLGDSGAAVETAENGKIAVDMVKTAPADYYACVLMDVSMPVMDGYEATRQIRALEDKRRATIPVIAMTANVFEEDREDAKAAGMDEHISKPIDIHTLFTTLQRYL